MNFDAKNKTRAKLLKEISEDYQAKKELLQKNVKESQALLKSMTESFYKSTREIDEKRTEFIRFFLEICETLPGDIKDYVIEWKKEHSDKLNSAERFGKLLENSVEAHKSAISELNRYIDEHHNNLRNIPAVAEEEHRAKF